MILESKPILDTLRAPTPLPTAALAPTSADIHTIEKGHLLDHERSGSCWCGPSSAADGDRLIWTHYGENAEHYPAWQTHPETGAVLTDADGEMLPTKRIACRCCGALMPQGRHHVDADCVACVTQPARQAKE